MKKMNACKENVPPHNHADPHEQQLRSMTPKRNTPRPLRQKEDSSDHQGTLARSGHSSSPTRIVGMQPIKPVALADSLQQWTGLPSHTSFLVEGHDDACDSLLDCADSTDTGVKLLVKRRTRFEVCSLETRRVGDQVTTEHVGRRWLCRSGERPQSGAATPFPLALC